MIECIRVAMRYLGLRVRGRVGKMSIDDLKSLCEVVG